MLSIFQVYAKATDSKGYNIIMVQNNLETETMNLSLQKEPSLKLVKKERKLIKSKERVQHHGEVFTPHWMVKKMLAEPSIQEKLHDLHATFLEPSAGEGAFLIEILDQKLDYVDSISHKNDWCENAIWALMSIYGIELLTDNILQARHLMVNIVTTHYQKFFNKTLSNRTDFYKPALFVINTNIVQGNALTYMNDSNMPITFSEWNQIDKNTVKRDEFTYRSLFDDETDNVPQGQLSLFDFDDDQEQEEKSYAICPVTKVYKEIKE